MSADDRPIQRQRVLGIAGSPRAGGNTETLVDEVLRGAQEAGAQVEKVLLRKLSIAPCQACDTCRRKGVCIHQDDMPGLLEKMRESDVWVLGTPVYWYAPSALFKAFLDRWYGGGEVIYKNSGQRVILAVALEAENPAVSRHTVGGLVDTLDWLKMAHLDTVLAAHVHERGAVRAKSDVMTRAYRAGRDALII